MLKLQAGPYADPYGVNQLAFSPDGKIIASAGWMVLMLWDTATGALDRCFSGAAGRMGLVSFSPNGKLLATRANDAESIVWNLESNEMVETLPGVVLTFSRDSTLLIFLGKEHNSITDVRIQKVAESSSSHVMQVHISNAQTAVFTHNGRLLAIGGEGCITIIEPHTWKVVHQLAGAWADVPGHSKVLVSKIAFSPDDRLMATAADDGVIRIWSVEDLKLYKELKVDRMEKQATDVCFSPDGKFLAAARGGDVLLWTTSNWKPFASAPRTKMSVTNIAFSPNGHTLALAGVFEPSVELWDFEEIQAGERDKKLSRVKSLN